MADLTSPLQSQQTQPAFTTFTNAATQVQASPNENEGPSRQPKPLSAQASKFIYEDPLWFQVGLFSASLLSLSLRFY
jgi:hypothetical protein